MKKLIFLLAIFLLVISAYSQHYIGVFGSNEYGQLGNGTAGGSSDESVVFVGTDADWINAACGHYHTLAIKENHSLWAWGRNNKGQLGDGTKVDKYVPTQIDSATNWADIAGGEAFSMAIKTDGTLWGWGENTSGQLGDGTTNNDKPTPTQIGTENDWAQIACGKAYVLALKTDSSLWAWGDNSHYNLGDGTTIDKSTPVLISNEKWTQIETSIIQIISMALKSNRIPYRWGEYSPTPTAVHESPILKLNRSWRMFALDLDSTLIRLGIRSSKASDNHDNIPNTGLTKNSGSSIYDNNITFSSVMDTKPITLENQENLISTFGYLTETSDIKTSKNSPKCRPNQYLQGRDCFNCPDDGPVPMTPEDFELYGNQNIPIIDFVYQYITLLPNGEVWTNQCGLTCASAYDSYQYQINNTEIWGNMDAGHEHTIFFTKVENPVTPPDVPLQLVFTTTAASQTVKIPLDGTVDVIIDWGDGSTPDTITSAGSTSHVYATAGTDTVSITGTLTGLGLNANIPEYYNYLTEVTSWGNVGLENLRHAFLLCSKLTDVPDDLPSTVSTLEFAFNGASIFNDDISTWNTENVSNMAYMFLDAPAFNQDISSWDVGKVVSMYSMFCRAYAFNQDISAWDISSAANMGAMFFGLTLPNATYNAILNSWAAQTVKPNVAFGAGNSMFSIAGLASRQSLIDDHNWTITDGGGDFLFDGGGIPTNPFQIATLDDLKILSENNSYWGSYFIQTADIDASDTRNWNISGSDTLGFSPIGNNTNKFQASYDGGGHTIDGLYIHRTAQDYVGLIGNADTTSLISTIGVTNVNITGNGSVGGLTGNCEGTINQCFTTGAVSGSDLYVGGLSGNSGSFSGTGSGTISDSYSKCTISGSGNFFGGLIGNTIGGTVSNCYATGLVGNASLKGGLIAQSYATTTNSFWDVNTSNQSGSAAGIGKTSAEMKTEATFTGAGWDFVTTPIWEIDDIANEGYPYLSWQTFPAIPLQLVFTTAATNQTVKIPLNGTVDVIIDWGDGSDPDTITSAGSTSHVYATAGTDTVSITGTLTGLGSSASLNEYKSYLTKVLSFGGIGLEDLSYAFFNCGSLIDVPDDLPSSVTNLASTFNGATNFNDTIGDWNTENVTNMNYMFANAYIFNQDIEDWDVGKVTDMSYMFFCAYIFDQDIGDWDVGNVTDMNTMFCSALDFNQDIGGWNTEKVMDMSWMFCVATAFNQDIGDWDVSNVTNMAGLFNWTPDFNQDIGSWNTGNVTDMSYMFDAESASLTAFDQNLGEWDISSVTTMDAMFNNVTLSTANYDSTLMGWAAQSVQGSVVFDGGNSQYTCGVAANARDTLSNAPNSWIITDDGLAADCPMQLKFENFSCPTLNLPLYGTVNCTVDWGDGSSPESFTTAGIKTHDYSIGSDFIIRISGILTQFGSPLGEYGAWKGHNYLTEVISLGNIGLTSLHGAFRSSSSLAAVPEELPATITDISRCFQHIGADTIRNLGKWNVENVTKMDSTFFYSEYFNQDLSTWNTANVTSMVATFGGGCSAFNQDISGWDVDNVTNMSEMFEGAEKFDVDISSWNVSNVTNMSGMFSDALLFNQNIGDWDVSKVTDMSAMFSDAQVFNQNIGIWNVSNVTDMSDMLSETDDFNQNIGSWDVAGVTNMSGMFSAAEAFNQNIGSWNVSSVTNMFEMFKSTEAFNQNIGSWNVSSVTNMESMFQEALAFNQNINNWNVSSVTNMKDMFQNDEGFSIYNQALGNWNVGKVRDMSKMFKGADSFNQDIGNWDVSKVKDMSFMFAGDSVFNQNIGTWNVDSVTYMDYMFENASAFNQNIGSWNVDSVTSMLRMFENASSFNHDLGNWQLNSNVNLSKMLKNCGMDCSSYSTTLKGWAENTNIPTGRNLGADGLTYGADAAVYRLIIINSFSWTINGDIAGTSECLCADPNDGGTIADAQTICYGTVPNMLTSTALPTGHTGVLEYKWQSSTTSDATGFTDISSSDAAGFAPGSLTFTTWYKRLARVDCMANWTGAVESNVVEITVEATPVSGTLAKTPDVDTVCKGNYVSAALSAGSGGNGTDSSNYRTNNGTDWSAWAVYTPETDISTSQKTAVEIRTKRVADYCNDAAYNTESWTVEQTPVSGTLAKTPDVNNVCEGDDVSAASTAGSGGNGNDSTFFRTNNGTNWAAWAIYTSETDISTSGKTAIEIRTKRAADYCDDAAYNTKSWTVEQTPVSGTLAKYPNVDTVCIGDDVSAALSAGSGGNGNDSISFRTHDGSAWSGWINYTSGTDISTTGKTNIEIQTIRQGTYCNNNGAETVSWNTFPKPVAFAGNDASIIDGENYILSEASAINYTSISWSTAGDGGFDNENVLKPSYTPGTDDIVAGNVELTLTIQGLASCNFTDDDQLTLTIFRAPTVVISSPLESDNIYDTVATFSGTASDPDNDLSEIYVRVNEGTWQLATGTENWTIDLPMDFGNKKIEAKAVDAQSLESELVEVTIFVGVQLIPLHEGWSHFSSFLDPLDGDIETIMEYPVGLNLLSIMVNNSGKLYWPSQNINLIGNWNYKTAYKIFMEQQSAIVMKGNLLTETTLQLGSGAKYLPVLSNVEVAVEDAFENPMQDIRVMFNHITNQIYWPEGGLFTLQTLKPGEGYLANLINPATVTFPDYDLDASEIKSSQIVFDQNSPWQVTKTGDVHLISIFSEALAGLENFSHIGAFDSNGNCIGFADITAKGQNNLLTVYADDIHTTCKDGAEEGEFITFRAYHPASGTENELLASYNESFPNHDGLFAISGLSAITGFKEGSTGIGGSALLSQIRIYPNPTSDELNIIFDAFTNNGDANIELTNSNGSIVLKQDILQKQTKLDIQNIQPGMYVLKIAQNGAYSFRKVVIQY